jgi:hypothetical protein
MTLILAVRDDSDIVVACDGRVLAADLTVLSNDSPKTLALNPELCLGLGGVSDSMQQVLRSLGLKCRNTHPIDLLNECQEIHCPVDIDYRDARDEVGRVLRWMIRRVPLSVRRTWIPVVVLAGRYETSPALCGWNYPTWTPDGTPRTGYSQAVFGRVPEEGAWELAQFQAIVRGERTTDRAESRLLRAVGFCARYFGVHGPVGGTVFLRRLSQGFRLTREEGSHCDAR